MNPNLPFARQRVASDPKLQRILRFSNIAPPGGGAISSPKTTHQTCV